MNDNILREGTHYATLDSLYVTLGTLLRYPVLGGQVYYTIKPSWPFINHNILRKCTLYATLDTLYATLDTLYATLDNHSCYPMNPLCYPVLGGKTYYSKLINKPSWPFINHIKLRDGTLYATLDTLNVTQDTFYATLYQVSSILYKRYQ